jgi:hypothetical protein
MLMPALSVTAIGLAVGMSAWVVRGGFVNLVSGSLVGAWLGFLVGAFVGVVIDVIARSGEGVVIVGHLAAAVGAIVVTVRAQRAVSTG